MWVGEWFKPRISIQMEKVIKFVKRNDIYSSKILFWTIFDLHAFSDASKRANATVIYPMVNRVY